MGYINYRMAMAKQRAAEEEKRGIAPADPDPPPSDPNPPGGGGGGGGEGQPERVSMPDGIDFRSKQGKANARAWLSEILPSKAGEQIDSVSNRAGVSELLGAFGFELVDES